MARAIVLEIHSTLDEGRVRNKLGLCVEVQTPSRPSVICISVYFLQCVYSNRRNAAADLVRTSIALRYTHTQYHHSGFTLVSYATEQRGSLAAVPPPELL